MKTSLKWKNKPDPALLQPSNLSNEIKTGTKISWDNPFNLFGSQQNMNKTEEHSLCSSIKTLFI
jgi:hypothetical protein